MGKERYIKAEKREAYEWDKDIGKRVEEISNSKKKKKKKWDEFYTESTKSAEEVVLDKK